jgi:hypothetical protein
MKNIFDFNAVFIEIGNYGINEKWRVVIDDVDEGVL